MKTKKGKPYKIIYIYRALWRGVSGVQALADTTYKLKLISRLVAFLACKESKFLHGLGCNINADWKSHDPKTLI